MQLKGKNKLIALLAVAVAVACTQGTGETSGADKQRQDSISKADQRRKADSIRSANPLLIVPPDSGYTGTYLDRYPSGIIKFRGFFRQGKRHGQWLSFYPNGEAWSEMHYDRGLRHGPNITYFVTGAKRYEGNYKNDARDSIWIYYDSSGAAVKRVFFDNDRIVKQEDVR